MAFSALVENLVPLPTDPVANEPQENDAKNAGVQIGEGMKAWESSSIVERRKTQPIKMKLERHGGKGRRWAKPATAQRLIRPMMKKWPTLSK